MQNILRDYPPKVQTDMQRDKECLIDCRKSMAEAFKRKPIACRTLGGNDTRYKLCMDIEFDASRYPFGYAIETYESIMKEYDDDEFIYDLHLGLWTSERYENKERITIYVYATKEYKKDQDGNIQILTDNSCGYWACTDLTCIMM